MGWMDGVKRVLNERGMCVEQGRMIVCGSSGKRNVCGARKDDCVW